MATGRKFQIGDQDIVINLKGNSITMDGEMHQLPDRALALALVLHNTHLCDEIEVTPIVAAELVLHNHLSADVFIASPVSGKYTLTDAIAVNDIKLTVVVVPTIEHGGKMQAYFTDSVGIRRKVSVYY